MSGEIRYSSACGACGPAVKAVASCVGEFGDEWEYTDYGSCNDCGFNCVSFGALGTACTAGTRAKCKHISYLGNKTSCCLGDGPGIAKYTCNPAYTVSNPVCDDTYATYCAAGDRIIKDPKCVNWRNIRPAQSAQTLQQYCTKHLGAQECREWCKAQADAGNGVCDVDVQSWCNSHPSDPYCACIKSPLQDPRYGINPKCNDRKCIDGGYITQNMRNTNCPDITNCEVQTAMMNSGVQLSGVTINQSCGKSSGGSSGGSSDSGGNGIDAAASALSAAVDSNSFLVFFIFILTVLLAVIVGYAITKSYVGLSPLK